MAPICAHCCSFLPLAAYGAACTDTTGCTEWITFNGGPARSMIYRTYPLTQRNENIKRAFILVHGAGRDADNYFRTATAAAFLAGALDDTIVISPRFASNSGAATRRLPGRALAERGQLVVQRR